MDGLGVDAEVDEVEGCQSVGYLGIGRPEFVRLFIQLRRLFKVLLFIGDLGVSQDFLGL